MKASAAALVLALAACATTAPGPDTTQASPPPAPPPARMAAPTAAALDPVGHYEFSTVVNGSPMTGTIHIEGQPGAYTGRLESNLFATMTVNRVTVAGQQMNLAVSLPDGGTVTLVFNFDGSNFSGTWSTGDQTGSITGRKTM